MKNIFYISILFLGLTLSSCTDFFNVLPQESLVQDEFWKTKEDVESVLMGSYYRLAQHSEKLFVFGELRADMIEFAGTNNSLKRLNNADIRPTDNFYDWSDYYEIISYANYVIDFAPEVKDKTYTDYQRQGHIAEAQFLRAFMYFNLVKFYKEVPLVLSSSRSDNQDFYVPKSTEDEIMEQVVIDLTAARAAIPEEYGDIENNKGRATPAACDALFTEVYLWMEKYDLCIEHANKVDTSVYAFLPTDQWFDLFAEGNTLEGIFEIQYDEGLAQWNDLYKYTYNDNGLYHIPTLVAAEKFYAIDSKEAIRNYGSMQYFETTTYRRIWKYAGATATEEGSVTRGGSSNESANWIVYRSADVYLMAAEAHAQLGQLDEAMEIVNFIRRRAAVPEISNPGTQIAVEDLVLEERAKELAFEGKRWWDLLRMARRGRKAEFIKLVTQKLPVNTQMVTANRLNDEYSWYFPITNSELIRNLNLEQNPYYAPYSKDIR